MAGIYIHVPFCITKCHYCDFYSVQGTKHQRGFIAALCKEIELRAYELLGQQVETIYWGGGTPSLLDGWQVRKVMELIADSFSLSPQVEVTLECNPGDLSSLDIKQHLDSGINRFSIGAQSFSVPALKFLKRRHSAQETIDLFHTIRHFGGNNISLDLIYGIPNTTMETLLNDIEQLLLLRPEHISTYHLIYEEGTPLYQQLKEGGIKELPEELSVEMMHTITRKLTEAGYTQYEIANFALPEYYSRHNSAYWCGVPYLGLGPSAHSYKHPWRSWNPADIVGYNDSLFRVVPFLKRTYEYITPQMAYEEYMLTRLRTAKGISVKEIGNRWGRKKVEAITPTLEQYIKEGYLRKAEERLVLTNKGIDISDSIMATLI